MRAIAKQVPRRNLDGLRQQAFHARMNTIANAVVLNQPEPTPSDIEQALTKEIENLDAISMLRFCFAIQKERVMQLRQLERTTNVTFPFGSKHLQVLKEIASELWRVQAGQALLRSKNSWPVNMGQAERAPIDLLPEVQEISALDPIDQNLIREALDKTVDLLHQQAGIGEYARRVEAESRRTETTQSSGDNRIRREGVGRDSSENE